MASDVIRLQDRDPAYAGAWSLEVLDGYCVVLLRQEKWWVAGTNERGLYEVRPIPSPGTAPFEAKEAGLCFPDMETLLELFPDCTDGIGSIPDTIVYADKVRDAVVFAVEQEEALGMSAKAASRLADHLNSLVPRVQEWCLTALLLGYRGNGMADVTVIPPEVAERYTDADPGERVAMNLAVSIAERGCADMVAFVDRAVDEFRVGINTVLNPVDWAEDDDADPEPAPEIIEVGSHWEFQGRSCTVARFQGRFVVLQDPKGQDNYITREAMLACCMRRDTP